MKKLFAILLAVAMVMGLALTASAAETTLPDMPAAAWWTTWSSGIEIPTDGVEVSFNVKATDVNNWNGPCYFLYSANVPNAAGTDGKGPWDGTDGYVEHWIQRGDSFGWHLSLETCSSAMVDAMAEVGITYSANSFAVDANENGDVWDDYRSILQAGTTGKIVAKRTGDTVEVTMDVAGVSSTVTAAVEAGKTAYLSLSVDSAELSNIKVKTADAVTPDNPGTGDALSAVIALTAVSAAGAAIVLKKKEF